MQLLLTTELQADKNKKPTPWLKSKVCGVTRRKLEQFIPPLKSRRS
jgi:hypothetical protein